MEPQNNTAVAALHRHFQRPALVIKVIALMLIGLGIGVALILKVYMLVLTDYTCMAEGNTLGNDIRCANTLSIVAAGLALAAGFEFAYLLFAQGMEMAIRPVVLGLSSAFVLVLSDLTLGSATWQVAMLMAALTLSMGGLFFLKDYFLSDRKKS